MPTSEHALHVVSAVTVIDFLIGDRRNVVLMQWASSSMVASLFQIPLLGLNARMISRLHGRQASGPLPPPPPTEYLNENLAPRMLAIDGILFVLALICVLLRVYVRAIMLKTFGIDGE